MSDAAMLLLKTAISLLMLVQSNPNLPAPLREQAIDIVDRAVENVYNQTFSKAVADSAVKARMNNNRAKAEIFYDSNDFSYVGFCTSNPDPMDEVDSENGDGLVDCDAIATAYAAEAQLVSSTDYYCVDSTSQAKTIPAPGKAASATSCP